MYKFCFFVPEPQCDAVKQALFDVGVGRIGDYDSCAWQTLGQGQYRPLDGSTPFIGERGEVLTVAEYKVEMLCAADRLDEAIKVFRKVHPYEEPVLDVWPLETIDEC